MHRKASDVWLFSVFVTGTKLSFGVKFQRKKTVQ